MAPHTTITKPLVALANFTLGAFWKSRSDYFDAIQIIVVMGSTGTGKSTFINTLAPTANFNVNHGLKSCTRDIQHVREYLHGTEVILVDTPGFDGTDVTDVDVLSSIHKWLSERYKVGRWLLRIIYLHRISDNRVNGTSFRQLQMFRRLCGDGGLSNVMMVSTMWESVSKDEGDRRVAELCGRSELWKGLIEGGAALKRFTNDRESATEIVSHWLPIKSEMVAG